MIARTVRGQTPPGGWYCEPTGSGCITCATSANTVFCDAPTADAHEGRCEPFSGTGNCGDYTQVCGNSRDCFFQDVVGGCGELAYCNDIPPP